MKNKYLEMFVVLISVISISTIIYFLTDDPTRKPVLTEVDNYIIGIIKQSKYTNNNQQNKGISKNRRNNVSTQNEVSYSGPAEAPSVITSPGLFSTRPLRRSVYTPDFDQENHTGINIYSHKKKSKKESSYTGYAETILTTFAGRHSAGSSSSSGSAMGFSTLSSSSNKLFGSRQSASGLPDPGVNEPIIINDGLADPGEGDPVIIMDGDVSSGSSILIFLSLIYIILKINKVLCH